jgi:acetyltransferase-like isoleucine patch superfamily enzyme
MKSGFLNLYKFSSRLRERIFSLMIAGGFARFGRKSVIIPPVRLEGERRIEIGSYVYIARGCWIQTLPDPGNPSSALLIGDYTSFAGPCAISAVRSVTLEDHVLLASNIYISDHRHRYESAGVPVKNQGIARIEPVLIKSGAWIGMNAVICPGVTVGKGAVVGANSVVNRDVPDFSIAAGAPARVIKTFG